MAVNPVTLISILLLIGVVTFVALRLTVFSSDEGDDGETQTATAIKKSASSSRSDAAAGVGAVMDEDEETDEPTDEGEEGEEGEEDEEGEPEAPPPPEPINCVGSWGEWSECDKECGGGTQKRTYTITQDPQFGGQECPNETGDEENQACNEQGCPKDCVGEWGEWGECDKTCGTGFKYKYYKVSQIAENGGKACEYDGYPVDDNQEEKKKCNTQECPVDCVGDWSAWGPCSSGSGKCWDTLGSPNQKPTKVREYKITTPPAHGGRACPHKTGDKETEECDTSPCPIDCSGTWTAWTECTNGGEIGQKIQTYSIARNPQYGGKACPNKTGDINREFCGLDVTKNLGAPNSTRSIGELSETILPGEPGKVGTLTVFGEWNKACGGKRTGGIGLWINDEQRYGAQVKERGSPRRKGTEVKLCAKAGDRVKSREWHKCTKNAWVKIRWDPNSTEGCKNGFQQVGGARR